MAKNTKKLQQIKSLEYHLRNYETYKVGIKNLQKQLDYIMPELTARYELAEGSTGTFNIQSPTEKYAIDRIESKKALDLHEDIKRYQVIIEAIDEALEGLKEQERNFIIYRYIKDYSVTKTAHHMNCSEKHVNNVRNITFNKLLISLRGILAI